MTLDKISILIKEAMLNRDSFRLNVLRSLKSEMKNREIELMRPLNEDEAVMVLQKAVKSREQAIELYLQGNRAELAEQEQLEVAIIKEYLPQPLTEEAVKEEVGKAIVELQIEGMKDMGRLMKHLTAKLGSSVDGKLLSSLVKASLS